jgi:hypothetical protein
MTFFKVSLSHIHISERSLGSASAASDWMAGPGVVYIFTVMVLGGQWGLALNIDHISPATIPCSETPSFLCITFLGSHTRRYTMHQHDLPLTPYGFIEMYVLLPHFCQSWLDGAVTQNWAATSLCY